MRRLLLLSALFALPLPAPAQEPGAEEDEGGGFFSRLFGGDEEVAAEAAAEDDEGFLTSFIEERLSATARDVDIQGFAGALSSRATIESLTISDREGVWLRAEDLALQWNRSALFSGRIEIEELTADTIEVLRPPIPDPEAPTPEATPFRLPELPVSLEIGTLRTDRIVLSEELLGEELVLALQGTVDLSGGEGTASIEAELLEGSEGALDFTGSYSNETGVLALDLDLEEAEGGLAARALGLPGLPSVSLHVEGTAPIDDYEANLSLATGGEPRVEGTFALQTTEEPGEGYVVERAFGLDVRGDVTPLVAPELAEFLGPDVRLRTKGIRRSDGSLVLTSLGIGTRALELTGNAEITPEGWPARFELRGTVGSEDGTPVPLPGVQDVTVGRVELELDYDRERGEDWTGTFAVQDLAREGLAVETLALEGGGTIVPATETEPGVFTAQLDYGAEGLAFAEAALGEALGADLAGEIDLLREEGGGPLRIRNLTLAGPGIEAEVEGTVAGAAEGFLTQTSILLEAEDLARFAELSGLDLSGSADLTVDSAVRPLDGIFDLSLAGTTQDLALGVAPLDPLLAGAGTVAVEAERDEAGLRVSDLRISTDAVTATGSADLTSGESEAVFDLDVTDLGLAFPELSGPGTIDGTFDRAADGAAELEAEVTLPGARVALDATQAAATVTEEGRDLPGLVTFTAEAEIEELSDYREVLATLAPDLPVAPAGAADLTLSGTSASDFGRFDVTVAARTNDLALGIAPLDAALAGEASLGARLIRTDIDALAVEDLRIDTPLVDGTLSANLAEGTAEATLDLTLADVAPVLGGLEGEGRVSGTARRREDGTTALDLDLALPTGTASVEGLLSTPPEGLEFAGDLAADLSDIAPLGTLLGRDLEGAVEGTASGRVRADLAELDLSFDLATRDLELGIAPLDTLLAGEGRHSGRVARDGADLVVEDLRIDTPLLDGTVTAALEDGQGSAEIDLTLADVAPVLGGLEGEGRLAGTARQTGDGTTALDLDLTLPTGTAAVEGTLAPPAEGFAFTGDLAADFEDLAPLGTLLGRDLGGALEASATGTLRPDLSALDLEVEAGTRDLRLGLPPVDALLAGEGRFEGRLARTGPQSFAIEDLTLDTDRLTGTVSGEFEDGAGRAELDLALPDVSAVLGGLEGPGRITGTASGEGDGTVALDLEATLPTGTATVDGTVDLEEGNAFEGDLAADFTDIAPLGPLVGRDLGGALRGTASGSLRPDLSALDLTFEAATEDLRLGLPLADPLLAGPGRFSGTVSRTPEGDLAADIDADTPLLRGQIEGNLGPASGEAEFDLALADVAPLVPGLSGAATATGRASRAADGSLAVDAVATGPGLRADVEATVAPPDQGSEIAGSAVLAADDLSILEPFVGRPVSGSFDGAVMGRLRPDLSSFDLTLDGTATDLSLGDPALARLLAGTGTIAAEVSRAEGGALAIDRLAADFPNLDVTATGTSTGAATEVAFDARLADLGLFVPDFPGPVTATGTAALTPAGATVDAQVTGPGGLTARVSGPLGGAATDLSLTGEAPLALANAYLGERRLEGPASFDLRLAGPPSLEALSGTVSVEGARLADPALREAVTGITGTATLAGGTATLSLEGDLGLGGRIAVTGPVALAPPFEADLTVTGTDLVIRDPALYEAIADARLSVTGPLAGGALISGVVDIASVEGRVPTTGVGALGEIPPIFHIEPSVPVRATLARAGLTATGEEAAAEDGGGAEPYRLDVLLRAPDEVFIRGRGLDAELGGELRLTGTTADIVPIGQFALLRGRLDLLGQRFELTEGSATLQGSFDPYVRLVAETEARTGTAIAIVLEGPLSSPEVSFTSSPELPEDEVLAQLLFGVEIEQITPLQAIRLASAVATLAGEGTGLLDDLRGGLGLADFDVTTTETGDIALRLGQYISENVYTDVVVSPEETEATINLDLTPDLTVRAAVSTEGETTIGIFFERDY